MLLSRLKVNFSNKIISVVQLIIYFEGVTVCLLVPGKLAASLDTSCVLRCNFSTNPVSFASTL